MFDVASPVTQDPVDIDQRDLVMEIDNLWVSVLVPRLSDAIGLSAMKVKTCHLPIPRLRIQRLRKSRKSTRERGELSQVLLADRTRPVGLRTLITKRVFEKDLVIGIRGGVDLDGRRAARREPGAGS